MAFPEGPSPIIPDRRKHLPPEMDGRASYRGFFAGKEVLSSSSSGLPFPDDIYTFMHWTG
jgi:hypothetical protein